MNDIALPTPSFNDPASANEEDIIRFVADCQRYMAETRRGLPRETLKLAVECAARLRQRIPQRKAKAKAKADEPPLSLDDL